MIWAIIIIHATVNVVTVAILVPNNTMHVQGTRVKTMELVTHNLHPISISVIVLLDIQVNFEFSHSFSFSKEQTVDYFADTIEVSVV